MKVVILCGGKGTRSYPFTEYYPKVMMPIGGTPVIVHLMRLYSEQGYNEFVLAAGYKREILEDYFAGRFDDWRVTIVDTGLESDTADRILRCEKYLPDTFMATYGDGLGDIDLRELLQSHRKLGKLATLTVVPLRSQYGVVMVDEESCVREFQEKPVIRNSWINAGFFVFERSSFKHWRGHNLERDVLPALAAIGELSAHRHVGFWKSMDTSKDQQDMENLCSSGQGIWAPRAQSSSGF